MNTAKLAKSVSKVSLVRTTERIAKNLERYGYVEDYTVAHAKLLVIAADTEAPIDLFREASEGMSRNASDKSRDKTAASLIARMKKVRLAK